MTRVNLWNKFADVTTPSRARRAHARGRARDVTADDPRANLDRVERARAALAPEHASVIPRIVFVRTRGLADVARRARGVDASMSDEGAHAPRA